MTPSRRHGPLLTEGADRCRELLAKVGTLVRIVETILCAYLEYVFIAAMVRKTLVDI